MCFISLPSDSNPVESLIKPRRRRLAGLRFGCAAARSGRAKSPFGRLQSWFVILILCLAATMNAWAGSAGDGKVRVGVLKYGSVSWEMAVVQANNLARKRGIKLEVVPYASENALAVALQGDRVDLIVSDWLWVARQRAAGRLYQYAPYSMAVGAVMVNPDAGIDTVEELAGHKIGVAGGPVNKTWLLLRAYADVTAGMDLKAVVEPKFAAPPILNNLMLRGRLPAVINYWQYNARLKGHGMEPLITVDQMLAAMGVSAVPPLLGWVFEQAWAEENRETLKAFLDATYAAKAILAQSDAAWEGIRGLIKPENDTVFAAIKAGYRAGIPQVYGQTQIESARQLFRILAKQGGGELVGEANTLPREVFWDGFRLK